MAIVKKQTQFAPARRDKKKKTKAAVNRSARGWWEHEKKKPRGIRFCERCGAVFYDGHWHTSPRMSLMLKEAARSPKTDICLQCRWVTHGPPGHEPFEGELTLDGLVDPAEKSRVIATMRNVASAAAKRDPEAFILNIDDRNDRVVVTTTENQLAVHLGKAVNQAFKGGRLRISWSNHDLPARVHWWHKP